MVVRCLTLLLLACFLYDTCMLHLQIDYVTSRRRGRTHDRVQYILVSMCLLECGTRNLVAGAKHLDGHMHSVPNHDRLIIRQLAAGGGDAENVSDAVLNGIDVCSTHI